MIAINKALQVIAKTPPPTLALQTHQVVSIFHISIAKYDQPKNDAENPDDCVILYSSINKGTNATNTNGVIPLAGQDAQSNIPVNEVKTNRSLN